MGRRRHIVAAELASPKHDVKYVAQAFDFPGHRRVDETLLTPRFDIGADSVGCDMQRPCFLVEKGDQVASVDLNGHHATVAAQPLIRERRIPYIGQGHLSATGPMMRPFESLAATML
jgi:hypothetical protein